MPQTGHSRGESCLFNIGAYTIQSRCLLAPMAGVTDLPTRRLCRRFGAGLTTSEMVTSDTRLWQSNKSRFRLQYDEDASPLSVQIAGSEPQMMANAAEECVKRGAHIIDINMGCPAKKVCKKLAGSALLKDEKLVAEILQAVVQRVDVPVTLKTRTGWDNDNKNAVRVARMAEDIGIAAIALHGRTRACRFKGAAEYETIAEVVENINIPVIANGDICNPQEAVAVLKHTGAAAVMIGRAALGNPWVFSQINSVLQRGVIEQSPQMNDIKSIMLEHLCALHDFYGEPQGIRIARKHIGWYCKHLNNGDSLCKKFNIAESVDSQIRTITTHFEQINTYEEKAA